MFSISKGKYYLGIEMKNGGNVIISKCEMNLLANVNGDEEWLQ